ncbi:hypothetical protein HMPREF1554_01382 [Porphyromonas gingivalis F0569]|nr:hypothetical protein HMPREF1554_01382 [Porphyromonas gingivalis F0569]ERJ82376.1 hypothetical protein HMPREF1988_01689 [Porphyromonas gingivalis F0185]
MARVFPDFSFAFCLLRLLYQQPITDFITNGYSEFCIERRG